MVTIGWWVLKKVEEIIGEWWVANKGALRTFVVTTDVLVTDGAIKGAWIAETIGAWCKVVTAGGWW